MARPRKSDNRVSADLTILTAATRLFAERGYAGTPLRDIAQASGVALGTITHHFGDKRELYIVCARKLFVEASARHRGALVGAANPAIAIRSFVEAICVTSLDPLVSKFMTRDLVDEEHLSLNLIPTNASGFVDEYEAVFDQVALLYGPDIARLKTYGIGSLVFGLGRLNEYFQQAISADHRPEMQNAHDLADFVMLTLFPDAEERAKALHP